MWVTRPFLVEQMEEKKEEKKKQDVPLGMRESPEPWPTHSNRTSRCGCPSPRQTYRRVGHGWAGSSVQGRCAWCLSAERESRHAGSPPPNGVFAAARRSTPWHQVRLGHGGAHPVSAVPRAVNAVVILEFGVQ